MSDESEKPTLENVLKRRFFVVPSFEIYGGVSGLYDLGPPACAIQNNLLSIWRHHFIVQEDMMEISATNLVPSCVLEASGHVAKFADLMIKDTKTGECYRADKVVELHIEDLKAKAKTEAERKKLNAMCAKVEGMDSDEMYALIQELEIKTKSGNDFSEPFPFNLMFSTSIGPSGHYPGFLRPETAQGMFVNFKRALDFSRGTLPFAMAQVGNAFRNEISPRGGLIRVREFLQAEVEHFMPSKDADHPRYHTIKDVQVAFLSEELQKSGEEAQLMTIEQAMESRLLQHQTIAYFLARTQQFLVAVGVDPRRLRFRQHLTTQRAHYARDCWDAEADLSTETGWTEIVGIADRSAFDLRCHEEATGQLLKAFRRFDPPRQETYFEAKPVMSALGKAFKRDSKVVRGLVEGCEDVPALKVSIETDGQATLATEEGREFVLTAAMVKFKSGTRKISGENFTPYVCEPSFGIGRILCTIFDHAFYVRESEAGTEGKKAAFRSVFRFNPVIAPTKVAILPVVRKAAFEPVLNDLCAEMRDRGVTSRLDATSVTIGRRYARLDEIGVPFGITVDSLTLQADEGSEEGWESTVTLRERDTMSQVRIPLREVGRVVEDLCRGRTDWEAVSGKYPAYGKS
eukprot:gnl/Dysnectes_brevis/1958_a2249_1996.p1 GENE.gnl/Dysnectes_brevis/1958_a2249_1996~~gnl/Dysnectes_brevis/1958_a2249_1996.p1  ORF type:complete len:640 (+),score=288.05 gnl/Dysnectes_brevis/1958_a2249_1996:31-1920(+)